ncbi:MAG: ATP synthase F0 subunit C [Deltaproteobacteria bacterium]|nr:ATP synthase F0 subunit C [Deltaproteobacteria bacterium]
MGLASLVFLLSGNTLVWAAEEGASHNNALGGSTLAVLIIALAFCVPVGTIFPALGQTKAIKAACDGMARNPAVAGKLMTTMILGLAMLEALAIYALVVALVLIFANPFIK